jgi:SAM-dependent methyltransferase
VPPTPDEPSAYWQRVHAAVDPVELSWYQREPALSLELLDALGVAPGDAVVDVGAGSSPLVDRLVERGFDDVTVLDVAEAALAVARARLGARADAVAWVHADVREWRPARRYDAWHDRALFHFLVDKADRRRYVETLRHALRTGGAVVIATFAPDGPPTCSGLAVARYDVDGLAAALAPGLEPAAARREEHVTPAGRVQPFSWAAFRLRA